MDKEKRGKKACRILKICISSLISLDESDEEHDTLVTRPLVCRVEEVSAIFQGLDLGQKMMV